MTSTSVSVSPTTTTCAVCRDMRHVKTEAGYERCRACFGTVTVVRELRARGLPAAWADLKPEVVIGLFGGTTPIGQTLRGLLVGSMTLVHAYGMPSDRRTAFTGALVYGFLELGCGVQVLNTADLAFGHFDKANSLWSKVEAKREPVILTFGREVEARLGLFYFRTLLERADAFHLPFVLLTDYPLATHAPRYPDFSAVVASAPFAVTDLALSLP